MKIFPKSSQFFALLLIFFGGAFVSADPEISVVHGHPVDPNDPVAKVTVGVYGHELGMETVCTGTLIAEDLAVTAGHCKGTADELRLGLDLKGNHVIRIPIVAKATTFSWWGFQNDITLLYFKGGIPQGYAKADILPMNHLLVKGEKLLIAGFGETKNNQGDYGKLRAAPNFIGEPTNKKGEVVLEAIDGAGACHGDSGGPAFITYDQHLYFFGVDSRSGFWGTCGHREIYTDVRAHLEWIGKMAAKFRSAG